MTTVTLTATPSNPKHGDEVVLEVVVTGNDGTPAGQPYEGRGTQDITVGSDVLHALVVLTLPGAEAVAPLPETYALPVVPGFVVTPVAGQPRKFKFLVP